MRRKKERKEEKETTILLVEDEEINLRLMEGMLRHLGHRIIMARSGREALKKYNRFMPDIVILDILMPRISGIEVLKEIRSRNEGAIVIMVTASNKEEHAIESLRLGANNYLKKPVHYDDLVPLIHKYNSTIQKRTMEKKVLNCMLSRNFSMEIDNDLQFIPKVAQYLANEASTLFDKDEIVSINIALLELLVNAYEHGNLGISYEEKSKAIKESRMEKLFNERMQDPRYADRKIKIEFSLGKDYCEWIITDEGDGFASDIFSNLNCDDRENEHGRGIFISRFHLDELEYLGKGNIVRALKRVK